MHNNYIRIAIDLDLPELFELGSRYLSEMKRWAKIKYSFDRAMHFASKALLDGHQQIFIKVIDDKIVGLMWGGVAPTFWSNDVIGYDVMLYVLPEYRSISVAKELVKEYEKWCKACGAIAIHTGSNSGVFKDAAASSLYKNLGYVSGGYNFFKDL